MKTQTRLLKPFTSAVGALWPTGRARKQIKGNTKKIPSLSREPTEPGTGSRLQLSRYFLHGRSMTQKWWRGMLAFSPAKPSLVPHNKAIFSPVIFGCWQGSSVLSLFLERKEPHHQASVLLAPIACVHMIMGADILPFTAHQLINRYPRSHTQLVLTNSHCLFFRKNNISRSYTIELVILRNGWGFCALPPQH